MNCKFTERMCSNQNGRIKNTEKRLFLELSHQYRMYVVF